MNNILEVDGVMLEFGTKRVLQDIYIKCETGKITGLLGRNGSGKTCLMNIIHGMLRPVNASVRINSKVLLKARRKPDELLHLTQLNYIPAFLTPQRVFADFSLEFSIFIEHFPDFEKYFRTKLKRLSGGERRIIEIYVIIASDTKFCMLDEPFSHIMPVHLDTIKKLIVQEKENKGILITDHMYEHITDICDDLYVIRDGKTFLTDNIQDLEALGYLRDAAEN